MRDEIDKIRDRLNGEILDEIERIRQSHEIQNYTYVPRPTSYVDSPESRLVSQIKERTGVELVMMSEGDKPKMTCSEAGRLDGITSSESKRSSAKVDGRKGGRPRLQSTSDRLANSMKRAIFAVKKLEQILDRELDEKEIEFISAMALIKYMPRKAND